MAQRGIPTRHAAPDRPAWAAQAGPGMTRVAPAAPARRMRNTMTCPVVACRVISCRIV
ncbi:hypothetical protein IFJ82_03925 [Novacetimonas hansenii]|uniref:Uncharacterized protein n=1 Tax=Novacetimonas hansenii ATCC 23769 TaxID=714995 RepID=D5QJ75_NOVHA|nr:hypothetical protein [Novacetimonas hansenii]EFG82897.1 hypothetical protein GXY_16042 [Novacetimonas hansenii ATCC 23769]MBL7235208.1 hypothetical protein [Novacetimonas hansenii]QOF95803.1 hypothetical protein IFJ82_03925 [Novacetimonas hansenii]